MDKTTCGFIAIVGRPNVGKSTLINRLVGEKVAIVSKKPQTTRTRITGVITLEEAQLIFIDTPGLHRPRTKLSEYMVKQVNQSVGDVDAAILVVEPFGDAVSDIENELIESFKKLKLPAVLAINKIDTVKNKELLMKRIDAFSHAFSFSAVVPISASTGDGTDILLSEVKKLLPEGQHMFDADSYTDQPERVIVGEIIREKILYNMSDEIPHGTAVVVESMKERADKEIMDIHALIYCERANHKGMLLGKGGVMIKKISTSAREDIEAFLDMKVNLQLWVKVKEDWRNEDFMISALGFK